MNIISEKLDAAFPRKVVKMPLMGPDNIPSPHYGICFEDATGRDDWVKATVKKNYQLHTREDVKSICLSAAEGFDLDPNDIRVNASWIKGKGHAVSITPTKEYRRAIANEKDGIWPSLIVRAYYGGAFKASVSMKRDLCSNLMMIRNVSNASVNLRHTFNFREHFAETVDTFRGLIAMSDNVVEATRMLAQVDVDLHETLDAIYPESLTGSKRSRTIRNNKLSRIKEIVRTERRKLGLNYYPRTASLWDVVNGITGYVQHDKGRRGNVTRDDRALMAVADRESELAWDSVFQIAAANGRDLTAYNIAA